jgi:hypothetical protein
VLAAGTLHCRASSETAPGVGQGDSSPRVGGPVNELCSLGRSYGGAPSDRPPRGSSGLSGWSLVAGGLSYLPSVEARTAEVAESLLVAAERLMEVSGIGGALEAGDLSPGGSSAQGNLVALGVHARQVRHVHNAVGRRRPPPSSPRERHACPRAAPSPRMSASRSSAKGSSVVTPTLAFAMRQGPLAVHLARRRLRAARHGARARGPSIASDADPMSGKGRD